MKKLWIMVILSWLPLLGGSDFGQSGETAKLTGLKGPYLGEAVPGKQPKIFAPGIVSQAGSWVSACTMSADGREFYFTNHTKGGVMVCRWTEQGWTLPSAFQPAAGHYSFEPHVTCDNKRIYWNWDNPAHAGSAAIYFAERTAAGWSAPQYAGKGMFISSSRDGELYTTHSGAEQDFVSRVVMKDNRFVGYKDLKGGIENIRSRSDSVAHPCVPPDGTYIIFDIEGGAHLFVSFKGKDGLWGDPIDLVPHGLDPKAGMASISPDGKYLFVSQKGDIYWVSTQLIEDLRPRES